jgi:hypothetical protein
MQDPRLKVDGIGSDADTNFSVSHTVTDGNKLSCASISACLCLPDTAFKSSDGILKHLILKILSYDT